MALFNYITEKFKLCHLWSSRQLNGLSFIDLDIKSQRRIEDYPLSVIIIRNESHPDVKYDIFERLNIGSTPLSAQELRNCISRGKGIELVKKLSFDECFQKVVSNRINIDRLKDQEVF